MTTPSMNPLRPVPSGPICAFGSRLAYTYFPHPAPLPEQLNNPSSGPVMTPSTDGASQGEYWFTIDDQLVYLSFFQDYGPLNIGCLYRFCLHLHNLLEDPTHRNSRIFLYSSDEPDKKVNAALLMSLYAMVVMRWSVADVLHPISCLELQPYRDAGYSRSDYHLHPQQILYGLSRALSHQLLDLSTFDLASYEKAEKVEEGDWNWITPGFLAFASPVEAGWNTTTQPTPAGGRAGGGGKLTRSFRNVLEEFENKNVKVVVRLNKKLYDRNHFLERGIDHVEMYFDDGTNPSMEMCREFIDLSDRIISAGGAVAVHCKAGLGRTGTLIGAYLIYKHGFTADEAIGFMRLMRPGSCVGPQQHFLYENQLEWVRWSAQDELRAELALEQEQQRTRENVTQASTSGGGGGEPTTTVAGECATRPITPPNESELRGARVRSTTPHVSSTTTNPPVTPRRQGGNVPGQPRKTPGRSRHGISAPEEKDKDSPAAIVTMNEGGGKEEEDLEMEAAVREEEEMEGVVLVSSSPNKKKRDSAGGGGGARKSLQLVPDDPEDEDEVIPETQEKEEELQEQEDPITMMPGSPKKASRTSSSTQRRDPEQDQDLQPSARIASTSSTRPKTPSTAPSSTRPTRIARSAGGSSQASTSRPLSAITDNKLRTAPTTTTRSGGSTSASDQAIARSRGAKNLNTVFEAVEGKGPGSTSTRSRYPLRNVSGRTTPTAASGSTLSGAGAGAGHGTLPPNSPSKLPTRIPAKRGAAVITPSSPQPPSTTTTTSASGRGHGGFNPANAGKESGNGGNSGGGFTSLANGLAKLGGGNKGRNVRRRRSSMGSQDFVQAG
ncbi:hypothetical protein JCM16303_006539 [Sporobolomyces ruberrimus]